MSDRLVKEIICYLLSKGDKTVREIQDYLYLINKYIINLNMDYGLSYNGVYNNKLDHILYPLIVNQIIKRNEKRVDELILVNENEYKLDESLVQSINNNILNLEFKEGFSQQIFNTIDYISDIDKLDIRNCNVKTKVFNLLTNKVNEESYMTNITLLSNFRSRIVDKII